MKKIFYSFAFLISSAFYVSTIQANYKFPIEINNNSSHIMKVRGLFNITENVSFWPKENVIILINQDRLYRNGSLNPSYINNPYDPYDPYDPSDLSGQFGQFDLDSEDDTIIPNGKSAVIGTIDQTHFYQQKQADFSFDLIFNIFKAPKNFFINFLEKLWVLVPASLPIVSTLKITAEMVSNEEPGFSLKIKSAELTSRYGDDNKQINPVKCTYKNGKIVIDMFSNMKYVAEFIPDVEFL